MELMNGEFNDTNKYEAKNMNNINNKIMKEIFVLTVMLVLIIPSASANWQRIGGSAKDVIVGHDNIEGMTMVYAVSPTTGDIFKYDGVPLSWTKIGGPGKKFVTSAGIVYGLSPDGKGIYKWKGTPLQWTQIGGPAKEIYGGGEGIYATNPTTGDIYKYDGVPWSWTKIGGPGKMFAVGDGGRLYGLSPDGSGVYKYSGVPNSWTKVGGPAGKIFAGGSSLYATNPTTGRIYKYSGVPMKWTEIGGTGKNFAATTSRFYGLSPDGKAQYKYISPLNWIKIGGSAADIYGGALGDHLYATNPTKTEIWHYWPSPAIVVISPNGGEYLQRGRTYTIKWYSDPNPGANVKIELLKAGIVDKVITSSTPNDGSQSWTVPALQQVGHNYKIRITSTTNSAYTDTSNNNFGIIGTGDTDGDALKDTWEAYGYDYNSDGTIDVKLPSLGANPFHKDIFVEVDWMAAAPGETRSHKPLPTVISRAVDTFAKANYITNPDGKPGISLHVELSNQVAHDYDLNPVITEFDAIKAANFPKARDDTHHYAVFGHGYGADTSSGLAWWNNFIVTLGTWGAGDTADAETGTFIHELGHNLGLGHGGFEGTNYKPNYLSIMNYWFQISGVYRNGNWGNYDYQRVAPYSLNENSLDENNGINTPGYGTRWFSLCSPLTSRSTTVNKPIDWNFNGLIQSSVAVDLNCDGSKTTLASWIDWQHIVYNGGTIGGIGPGDTTTIKYEDLPKELTLEEQKKIENDR